MCGSDSTIAPLISKSIIIIYDSVAYIESSEKFYLKGIYAYNALMHGLVQVSISDSWRCRLQESCYKNLLKQHIS